MSTEYLVPRQPMRLVASWIDIRFHGGVIPLAFLIRGRRTVFAILQLEFVFIFQIIKHTEQFNDLKISIQ